MICHCERKGSHSTFRNKLYRIKGLRAVESRLAELGQVLEHEALDASHLPHEWNIFERMAKSIERTC